MNITTAKWMLGAAALAFITMTASPAKATTVDFYTEASIDGGKLSGNDLANAVTFGSYPDDVIISFSGVTTSIDAPSFTSFGTINTLGSFNGDTLPANTSFVLDIFQTVPGVGSGTLDASLNGFLSFDQSSATIDFTVTSTTIDNVNYSLTNNPLALVPFTSNGGQTTIQGDVVMGAATPEPVTTAMVGIGLLGLGLFRRRKA